MYGCSPMWPALYSLLSSSSSPLLAVLFLVLCLMFFPPLSSLVFPSSFLPSSSRLGLLQGARGDLLQSLSAASTPVGLSFCDPVSVCLSSRPPHSFPCPPLLPPSSLPPSLPPSLSLLPSPPVPHGGAAALNAWKHAAFTYITSAVQLMSWSVSAVKWCQSCLERHRACWVGQYVRSYSCAECGERGDPRICLPFPPVLSQIFEGKRQKVEGKMLVCFKKNVPMIHLGVRNAMELRCL